LIVVYRIWLWFIEFDCGVSNSIVVDRIRLWLIEFGCGLSNSILVYRIWFWFIEFNFGLPTSVAWVGVQPTGTTRRSVSLRGESTITGGLTLSTPPRMLLERTTGKNTIVYRFLNVHSKPCSAEQSCSSRNLQLQVLCKAHITKSVDGSRWITARSREIFGCRIRSTTIEFDKP
jgi:hypothetical protein